MKALAASVSDRASTEAKDLGWERGTSVVLCTRILALQAEVQEIRELAEMGCMEVERSYLQTRVSELEESLKSKAHAHEEKIVVIKAQRITKQGYLL